MPLLDLFGTSPRGAHPPAGSPPARTGRRRLAAVVVAALAVPSVLLTSAPAAQAFGPIPQSQWITFDGLPEPYEVGQTDLAVDATASSTLLVTLSVDPASAEVCQVALNADATGWVISYLAEGDCTVTASQGGGRLNSFQSFLAATSVEQTATIGPAPVSQAAALTYTGDASVTVGDELTISATLSGPDGCVAGQGVYYDLSGPDGFWAMSETNQTDAAGHVSWAVDTTGWTAGTYPYTLYYDGDGVDCEGASVDGKVTVSAAADEKTAQTITFGALPAGVFGDSNMISATSDSGLDVTLAVADASAAVCSLSGSTLSYTGVGDCTVVASQGGNDTYAAATDVSQTVTVGKATPQLAVSAPALLGPDGTLVVSATLSGAPAACTDDQLIGLEVPVGDGIPVIKFTDADGTTSWSVSRDTWPEGVYTVTARYAGNDTCAAAMDATVFTVAAPGTAASGGGWYSVPSAGRVNVGFTVRAVKGADPAAYTGRILLVNNGAWKLSGTVTSYGLQSKGTVGVIGGTGDLYRWNANLGAAGDWELAKAGVAYSARFTPTTLGGKGKKASGSPGSFGVDIVYSGAGAASLPDSDPIPLKGGVIKMS